MSKHTPGPWTIDYGEGEVKAATKNMVCQAGYVTKTGRFILKAEDRANLVLIAAAPDLLEALEAMVETAEEEWGVDLHAFDAAHKALAAIAKAKAKPAP